MPGRKTRYKRGGKRSAFRRSRKGGKTTDKSSTNPITSYTKALDADYHSDSSTGWKAQAWENAAKILEIVFPSEGFTSRGGGKRSHSKRRRGGKRYNKTRLKHKGGTSTRRNPQDLFLNPRENPILGPKGDGKRINAWGPSRK